MAIATLASAPVRADKLDTIINSDKLRCAVTLDVPPMGSRDAGSLPVGSTSGTCETIASVFQQWNAFPHLTVLENVMLAPRKVLGKDRREAEAVAVRNLGHMGLGDKLKVYPSRLSGGQQQRMAMSPDYMLSDRVAFFHHGQIHEIGPPDQVIGDPRRDETIAFLRSVL